MLSTLKALIKHNEKFNLMWKTLIQEAYDQRIIDTDCFVELYKIAASVKTFDKE